MALLTLANSRSPLADAATQRATLAALPQAVKRGMIGVGAAALKDWLTIPIHSECPQAAQNGIGRAWHNTRQIKIVDANFPHASPRSGIEITSHRRHHRPRAEVEAQLTLLEDDRPMAEKGLKNGVEQRYLRKDTFRGERRSYMLTLPRGMPLLDRLQSPATVPPVLRASYLASQAGFKRN